MRLDEAVALIAPAIGAPGGVWADLGAGGGTFTRALAELLGPAGRVIAVERDTSALASLRRLARDDARLLIEEADFTQPLDFHRLGDRRLDGVLLANALHFVPAERQARLLTDLSRHVAPSGRIAVVEYEGRRPSRWVPAPVSFARFEKLASEAGLQSAVRVGERASAYGGAMYAAFAEA
jgi:SAM-dependent methyltransferase